MNLALDGRLGDHFTSKSQWARKVTEGWAEGNLFCLACASNRLTAHEPNRAVEDYQCPTCSRRVQLKAKHGRLASTVSNSAYEKKRAAILAGRAPDYCFMAYDRDALLVNDLVWVPGHFMTLSVVSKRKPLKATARRAGWIGSNLHLDRIPRVGKIAVVADGRLAKKAAVRKQFAELSFLRALGAEKRGWVTDVLSCLDDLALRSGSQFTLTDVYGCEDKLQALHPKNRNVRPKVRQQLQVLVAGGVIERVVPGTYRRL
ncbi:MAG: DpnI domain-containing protein [Candidatus Thermoplasmatota archaeon]